MTPVEQKQFTSDLLRLIHAQIMDEIQCGKIPAQWDGIELRQFIVDKATAANYVPMSRGRKADYNNTKLINNL